MTPDHRLVCLTTSAACGGAETSLLTLLRALRNQEPTWAITVIAPASGPLLGKCRSLGLSALVIPYPAALSRLGESGSTHGRLIGQGMRVAVTLPQYVTRLRRSLRDIGATIVHSNGVKAHVAAALAKPRGVRLVWHLHDYLQPRPMTTALLRRLARRADAIVANSDSVRADAALALGDTGIRRVHNAVDLTMFKPDGHRMDLAALAGLPDDASLVRVGLVATFARWKGHDVFIEAIERLHTRARLDLRAYIIGGAVYETEGSQWSIDELKRLVCARGLSHVIGFTGHLDDVPAAMRSLDIVVHASTAPEPFGMVIAESMASARPVVAVDSGGASELFSDRIDGLAYPARNAAELAERIASLMADPSWRAVLGAEARRTACARFSPDRMASEFREAYRG